MSLRVNLNILQLNPIIYNLAVKAVNAKGSSIYSNIEQFDNRDRLNTPENAALSAGVFSFEGVDNAENYQIIADYGQPGQTTLGTI